MDYLIIGGGWALYLAMHSLFAAHGTKRFVERNIPFLYKLYRLVYTLSNSFGFLVLMYLMAITPSKVFFQPSGYLRYVAMVLASWGVIVTVVSFRHISGMAFLGFKPEENIGLVRRGLHAYVRHPIYSGTILIIVGMMMYVATDTIIVSGVVILLYLPLGIWFEEQKLIEIFGNDYLEYKREVPAIIPFPRKSV